MITNGSFDLVKQPNHDNNSNSIVLLCGIFACLLGVIVGCLTFNYLF